MKGYSMKKERKDKGIYVRLTEKELELVKLIKEKHFFNVSAYFRQMIHDLHEKLENKG